MLKKSGHGSTLTDQQREVFEELKNVLKDDEKLAAVLSIPYLDNFLLRFLRATMKEKKNRRLFHLDQALARLREVVEFKEKHGIKYDMKRPENHDEFNQVYPYVDWEDNVSHVIVAIERFGLFHSTSKSAKGKYTDSEWLDHLGYRMEGTVRKIEELGEKLGEEVPGYNVIIDMKGVSLWSVLRRVKFVKFLNDVGAKNYPELLNRVSLVNCPRFINDLLKVAKAFVDPDTMSKFESFKNIPEKFKTEYDLSLLPKEYNGESEREVPIPLLARK